VILAEQLIGDVNGDTFTNSRDSRLIYRAQGTFPDVLLDGSAAFRKKNFNNSGTAVVTQAFEEGKNGGTARRGASLREAPLRQAAPPSATPPMVSQRILPRSRVERVLRSEGPLGEQLRTEPHQLPEGGTGLRLFPLKRGELLRLLGLRAGDVVLTVGGNPVGDAQEFLEAVGYILEGRNDGMDILRGGRRIRLGYRIQ